MHLHFVQSLEPLLGAGLGQSALSLHLAMRRLSYPDENHISLDAKEEGSDSVLLATRAPDFTREWPDVIQGVRKGPTKAHWSPILTSLAKQAVENANWFHGHGLYVWPNMWLGSEARKCSKPLIYHPQGFFDPWILRRSVFKKKLAHLLFEDANLKYVSWWRAVSPKEADQIRTVAGKHVKINIIPNGIDIRDVDAATGDDPVSGIPQIFSWMKRRRPKRLLFLSRIHPKKGLNLLVPAWARLTKEFPEWELLIVGPNEGGYQSVIEKMIVDNEITDSCWIYPPVVDREKFLLMRSADLFVLPSYSEGFPMAVLEASANRLPVVQTHECNFPELAHASGAWECQVDPESLYQTLREGLGADDSEREQRGRKGRELVENSYSWDKIARLVKSACES